MYFIFSTALRYSISKKTNSFAFFTAIMATLGIAIGICALIVVTSIMKGLEHKLQISVLDHTPHIIVKANNKDIISILNQENIKAAIPYIEGDIIIKTKNGITVSTVSAIDISKTLIKDSNFKKPFVHPSIKEIGKYNIVPSYNFLLEHNMENATKLRLISTKNARYTPIGLTPSQRTFKIEEISYIHLPHHQYIINANYVDLRRLLKIPENEVYFRLYLEDPFKIQNIKKYLNDNNFDYIDWTVKQGDFFKAVSMEKLAISVMLFLIIIVATFNILSALTMMVSSRKIDIAILKTLGVPNKKIIYIFLIMGLIYGSIGIILGVITGIPLSLYAKDFLSLLGINIFNSAQDIPIYIDLFNIFIICAICIVLTLLCSLYPAYKAANTQIVSNLVVS